ncbi:MAG: ComF family protein [Chitinophagia bacterium]|nr:ComF family protein [Chitinophagia bacterium]
MNAFLRDLDLPHALGALFFPHRCPGCGDTLHGRRECVCPECLSRFPETGFASQPDNPVERLFWGRVALDAATSRYYFTGDSAMQGALHALKYQGDKATGTLLGRLLGHSLADAGRFNGIDALIPMPLHPRKVRLRGYNQAEIIARGVSDVTHIPVIMHALSRKKHTDTQTKKSRLERWRNVSEAFSLADSGVLEGRRLLLVDDVVTTGSSLEACATLIWTSGCKGLSIATVAFAER